MNMTDEELEKAESFWSRKDVAEKHMDRDCLYEKIDEFLTSHKVCALACGGENFIRCTPLEYLWHNNKIWIFTEGGLKFRALRENSKVSAAIFDPVCDFGHLKSVQLQGSVEILGISSSEYKEIAGVKNIPLEALKKLPEPMWLLEITPQEMTFLNSSFKEEGCGVRQTWKAE
ncbi:MAG: pyridoxamine 5'-phosphate oxidase family protein [Eubacterium sp.]|nr:pyridoxamine 5'-phosphate oxidase family protein [Eubacterium sp.]MCH4110399.1 pyridoxamine 5'-phosphate oxidase family protein [Eubacterium sp.]